MNLLRTLPALVVVLVLACGGDSTRPADTDLSAGQILERAADRLAEATSFRFRLTHENGGTQMPLNLDLRTAEGDFQAPDRLSAEIEARAISTNVRVRAIAIEDRTWITNPFTRQWQSLPGGVSLRDAANPAGFVGAVVDEIRNAEVVAQERVDGVMTFKVTGRADSGAFRQAIGSARSGYPVEVEIWVGTEDFFPRKVRIIGPLENDDADNIVRELQLSRFNQSVDIRPP